MLEEKSSRLAGLKWGVKEGKRERGDRRHAREKLIDPPSMRGKGGEKEEGSDMTRFWHAIGGKKKGGAGGWRAPLEGKKGKTINRKLDAGEGKIWTSFQYMILLEEKGGRGGEERRVRRPNLSLSEVGKEGDGKRGGKSCTYSHTSEEREKRRRRKAVTIFSSSEKRTPSSSQRR